MLAVFRLSCMIVHGRNPVTGRFEEVIIETDVPYNIIVGFFDSGIRVHV